MGLERNALGLNGTLLRIPLFPSARVEWNSDPLLSVGLDVFDEASATVRGRKSFQEAAKVAGPCKGLFTLICLPSRGSGFRMMKWA
jgi:hypothetical protein